MVINSTNINKTNKHLSPLLNSLNTKQTTTSDVRNPGPRNRHKNVTGLNRLMGF